jgi:hypothetical protein
VRGVARGKFSATCGLRLALERSQSCDRSREELEEREREREKMGRKEKRVGPVTVINWDPHEFSPDLNLIELKNRSKGELKFGMRPHKIQVGISILT